MKNKLFLTLILVVLFLGSCVSPKDTNLLQDISYPTTGDVAPIDYKIIPGDQLLLKVYTLDDDMKTLFSMYITDNSPLVTTTGGGNQMMGAGGGGNNSGGARGVPDLPSNALNVNSDGSINIPYIGRINVKDLTVFEAKKIIGEKFSAFSPNVAVDVALRNRYFFVLGGLRAKSVEMSNLRMTIYQALALSGDIEVYADRKNVKILRQTSEGTEFKTFDLRSKDIVNSEYYYIQPNDVIYVQEMGRKFLGAGNSFTSIFGVLVSLVGIVTLIIKLTK